MRDTDYAFCVARLRANERYMLSDDDIAALIKAKDYEKTEEILIEKGFATQKGTVREIIGAQNDKLWQLLESSVPSKKVLDILCIVNDYFNIKAALKCFFTGLNPENYYIKPTTIDLQLLTKAINSLDFSALGGEKGECAQQAYKSACSTENGQNAEIIIDTATIYALKQYANSKKISLVNDICAFLCDTANIKIALRCQKAGKSKDFIETAVGECVYLERTRLVGLNTYDDLTDYLKTTRYAQGILAYEKGASDFEKWCDEKILNLCGNAKFTSFGFDPVCAFYYAKLNEIKNVRIILNCKLSGVPTEEIEQRVRGVYA